MQDKTDETPMSAASAIPGDKNTPARRNRSLSNLYIFPGKEQTKPATEKAATESRPEELPDPRTTDLIPGKTGLSSFPVCYNSQGDKVKLWDDDERPGETFEIILRRNDGAIEKAKDEFFAKVWYRRKFDMLHNRAHALEPFLPKDQLDALQNTMKNVERICEKKNLGPWNDFEWGMINGKLLALRWVLGEEWDASMHYAAALGLLVSAPAHHSVSFIRCPWKARIAAPGNLKPGPRRA